MSLAARSETPTAEQILEGLKARVRLTSSNDFPGCEFRKVLTVVEFDKDGTAMKTNEMVFKMSQSRGVARGALLSANGKPAAEKPGHSKEKDRPKPGQKKSSVEEDEDLTPWLDDKLLGRYDFSVAGEKEVNGRKTWVLTFEPKQEGLPTGDFVDRFLNRLHGEIWVDQTDSEVAYLDIRLINKVKVWGGILGQLQDMTFTVHREPLPGGVWVQTASEGVFVARKFLSTMRFRSREESSGYQIVPPTSFTSSVSRPQDHPTASD